MHLSVMRSAAARIGRLGRVAVLVALPGLFASASPAQVEPTSKRTCTLPETLRGTSGHVLVRYAVDEAGHVNFVRPVFVVVDPPEREEALVGSLQDCLKQWRYPSMEGGPSWGHTTVPALQAFHYFSPAPAGSEAVTLPDGRSIPKTYLEEIDALRLDLAKKLLAGSDYAEERETGWILRSNVSRPDRQSVIKTFHATSAAFDQAFPGRPPLSDERAATVFLFDRKDAFDQVAAFDRILRGPVPGGEYFPADATAYTFLSKQEQPLRMSTQTLAHEFTHHLVQVRLAAGRRVPYWVHEGIATFFEALRPPKDDRVDLAAFERGVQAQGSFRWTAPATRYLRAVADLDKAHQWPDFERFLNGEFEALTPEQSYGLSWALIHYLMNAESGALRQPFTEWVTGPMGSPDDPGIAGKLGRTPEQMRDALAAYARTLK